MKNLWGVGESKTEEAILAYHLCHTIHFYLSIYFSLVGRAEVVGQELLVQMLIDAVLRLLLTSIKYI